MSKRNRLPLRAPYDWPLKWQYLLAFAVVAVSITARWVLHEEFGGRLAFLLLFSALLPLALLVRPGPFLAAAAAGFLGVWLVFIPPAISFSLPENLEEIFFVVFGTAVGATALTAWLSRRARLRWEAGQREAYEAARRLQIVSDATPALISYLDSAVRLRVYNRAHVAWFGREDLHGLHLEALLGEEAFRAVRPHVCAALAGRPAALEVAIPHADDGTRVVQAQFAPNVRADGTVAGFYALATDITDRKRMENELRFRSEQFETLLNEAPLGVYLLDADLRIQQVNPIALPSFRALRGDLLGRPYADVVDAVWGPEAGTEVLRTVRRTLESGGAYHDPEFTAVRADLGVTQYYDWRVDRIVLPDGNYGVVCYFRDISEQVHARHAGALSEERYRTLFETIAQGFCIVQMIHDRDGAPVDFRYLETNPAFEKHSGIKDAVGRTIQELVPGIEPAWFEVFDRVAVTGEPVSFVRRAESMERWFEVEAFRIGDPAEHCVAFLFADVTARQVNAEALRESERRFRFMADSAPVLIWLADARGDVTYFNRQWLRFTGRCAEEELGDGWMDNLHPDDREPFMESWRQAFAARVSFRIEYRLKRYDGKYRWLVDEGVPRFLPNGHFAGFIGSCIDITERKRSEEVLRETDRRKDEFLATLAHELRNPLAAISTATTVLKGTANDSARLGQMTGIIERQCGQLVRLIDDLLDVTRVSRGKIRLDRKPIDIADIVRQSVADFRAACEEKELDLVAELPETPVIVSADAVRVAQVINNLLENACKFTPRGGRILAAVTREGNAAVIRIADTGIGIREEQRGRIFEMFGQGEEWGHEGGGGGLGIGLSLARSVVELHGGRITVASEGRDRGSEFVVRLPECPDRSDADTDGLPLRPPSEAGGSAPRRVLVADDNRDMLKAVELMLRLGGHEVATATDGIEALDLLRREPPDVALVDIGMPRMNGYQLAQAVRQEPWGRNLLLVAMTGWGQKRDKQQAREAGFDRHLTKPVSRATLEELLAAAGERPPDHEPERVGSQAR